MADKQFVKGLRITKKESKYGNFLKCSIKVKTLTQENYITDEGWLNFDIFESKEGVPYAVIDTYGT